MLEGLKGVWAWRGGGGMGFEEEEGGMGYKEMKGVWASRGGKISGIEVVTPEATNILVWFGSLYVFISP